MRATQLRGYTLAITVVMAVSLLVAVDAPPATAATGQPIQSGFPEEIDPYQPRDPQRVCDPRPKPGVVDFANLLLASYPASGSSGISRACGVRGPSEHKEGRAFDWAVSASNPEQRAAAENALNALLATDEHGNRHAYFRRFGLMYIIWNRRIFSSAYPEAGWRPYACNPAASYDSCHVNHVHFSFSRAGAERRTSWWTMGPPSLAGGGGTSTEAGAAAPGLVERVAGKRRIGTAVAVAKRAFPERGSAEEVFVADAASPHDATVASVMAGAFHGAVLLTDRDDELERPVAREVRRLLGGGRQGRLTFVGGEDALPEALLDAQRDRYTVRRIAGVDHYATARIAANEVENRSDQRTAVVVGTSGVLDALPLLAVAAANDWPVVFTDATSLPASTRAFLEERQIAHVHIAGPEQAVSREVADEIAAMPGLDVQRHSGEDRYHTSVLVAEQFFSLPSAYAVASGRDWSDAVVGAAYAGERRHAPMLLTDGKRLSASVREYIETSRSPGAAGVIIGGEGVVSPKVERQLDRRLR